MKEFILYFKYYISAKIQISEKDLEKYGATSWIKGDLVDDVNKVVFLRMYNMWKEEAKKLTYEDFVSKIRIKNDHGN
jgi:hypothetical protein